MNTPRSKAGAPARTGSADLLEWAWGIIANAGGGNWELESPEWREAASRWRDAYHGTLSALNAYTTITTNTNETHRS